MDLTLDDIATLIEAIEAWEQLEDNRNMTSILLGTMFAPNKEAAESRLRLFETRKDERDTINRKRKEKSVMLRAKLLKIRASLFPDD
jgi:hypothetical protein